MRWPWTRRAARREIEAARARLLAIDAAVKRARSWGWESRSAMAGDDRRLDGGALPLDVAELHRLAGLRSRAMAEAVGERFSGRR